LFRDFGILANNLVELTGLAKQADPNFEQTFGPNRYLVSLAHVSPFKVMSCATALLRARPSSAEKWRLTEDSARLSGTTAGKCYPKVRSEPEIGKAS
jgi:hypothetical protein